MSRIKHLSFVQRRQSALFGVRVDAPSISLQPHFSQKVVIALGFSRHFVYFVVDRTHQTVARNTLCYLCTIALRKIASRLLPLFIWYVQSTMIIHGSLRYFLTQLLFEFDNNYILSKQRRLLKKQSTRFFISAIVFFKKDNKNKKYQNLKV